MYLLQQSTSLTPYLELFITLSVCFIVYYYFFKSKTPQQTPNNEPQEVLSEREQEKRDYFKLLEQEVVHDIYKEEANKNRLRMLLEYNDEYGDFNPTDNETLRRFNSIKKQTACIYAKKAKVWGAPWDDKLSARENFKNGMPVLANFVTTLKLKRFMDAIVFEARGDQYCNSVKAVCDTFRELCLVMSANDPCKSKFMARYPDEFPFWSLTFGDEAFFVTTFAKCYPAHHPRYSYGVDSLFILMQPEISFAVHEIPVRGPPGTPRWKIREAFKAVGQPYEHNEPAHMPVAWWFVRPIDINTENLLKGHVTQDDENGDPVERGYEVVPWWLPNSGFATNSSDDVAASSSAHQRDDEDEDDESNVQEASDEQD